MFGVYSVPSMSVFRADHFEPDIQSVCSSIWGRLPFSLTTHYFCGSNYLSQKRRVERVGAR